jgi:hypothetical protein
MKNNFVGLVLAAAIGVSGSAFAQPVIQFGPGGVQVLPRGFVEPEPRRVQREISERQAIRIARRNGVEDVDSVRVRRNTIRVAGFDRYDDDIVVIVDRYNGNVVDVF